MFPRFLETTLPYAMAGLLLLSLSELTTLSRRVRQIPAPTATHAAVEHPRPSQFRSAGAALKVRSRKNVALKSETGTGAVKSRAL